MEQFPATKPVINSRLNVRSISFYAGLPDVRIQINPIRPIHDVLTANHQQLFEENLNNILGKESDNE